MGNAFYGEEEPGKDNISPFEFIPWVLGQCATVEEARVLLERVKLVDIHFSETLQLTPMHWMIADRERCIVVEPLREGMRVYDNPVGVLTNNPPFVFQMMNLNRYLGLSRKTPEPTFGAGVEWTHYSRGMGAKGLPGDLSSDSRFVRAAFHKLNAVAGESEKESVNQFFHLLGCVEMPRGSLELEENVYEITVYSSCCNTQKGIYYYTTYENRRIVGVDMHGEDLEGTGVITYELE